MSQYPDSSSEHPQVQEAHLPLERRKKSFVVKSWKLFPAVLLLALFLVLGQGAAHAATNTAVVKAHPHSPLACNWRRYALTSSLRLVNQDRFVVDLQASNLDGQNTVRIWHNSVYQGESFLPVSDGDQIEVYQGSTSELVDACANWVSV